MLIAPMALPANWADLMIAPSGERCSSIFQFTLTKVLLYAGNNWMVWVWSERGSMTGTLCCLDNSSKPWSYDCSIILSSVLIVIVIVIVIGYRFDNSFIYNSSYNRVKYVMYTTHLKSKWKLFAWCNYSCLLFKQMAQLVSSLFTWRGLPNMVSLCWAYKQLGVRLKKWSDLYLLIIRSRLYCCPCK